MERIVEYRDRCLEADAVFALVDPVLTLVPAYSTATFVDTDLYIH
jgi:hypothetical protein